MLLTDDMLDFTDVFECFQSKIYASLGVPAEVLIYNPYHPIKSLTINIRTKPKSDPNYPHKCSKCGAPSYNCPISGKEDCSKC